ncbi:MAG: PPC domain-containing protein [Deltaproteobacteria bacterium]|nr:PPC domain-containing protein [Deltaproteobacteria bacterium]
MFNLKITTSLALSLGLMACAQSSTDVHEHRMKGTGSKSDSSVEAVFVELEFDGEVLASSFFNPRSAIDDQLLYTIGHLNGHDSNGVGRLDKVEITDIQTSSAPGGMTRISYHAVLPAAWGQPDEVPNTHTLRLPKDISFAGQEAFTDKYKDDCVDWLAHDVDTGIMWYYYRPLANGCDIDPDDVVEIEAEVSLSSVNTTGKYPEYHKIWEDDALRVVAIFGKNEADDDSNSDAGVAAFNSFSRAVKSELSAYDLVTEPASIPYSPGVDMPDLTFTATLPDGKTVEVVALLIDGVQLAGPEFDARYESLTPTADLVSYAGHSGLGANIRALAQKGEWVTGQYAVVYMGGCDTYAYVDSALADAHAAVNPDDPNGTKYMDIITNAQPAFFHENPRTVMGFVRGLLDYDNPKTFENMFADVDDYQVILVSGEEDNVFVPGGGSGDVVEDWQGLTVSGTVAANAEVHYLAPAADEGELLAAGRYVFELSGDADADLYVKIGGEPTVSDYDCRPYLYGSSEVCEVELSSPAPVYIMVRGWDPSSSYELIGSKE